jgi:4-cresol dehydrogenase (hydroxylating)
MRPCEFEAACIAWTSVVGNDFVVTSQEDLRKAATATFATDALIPAILIPGSREEVQECVRIANRHHVAVYPISTGKNWGYGSRVPASDQCALIDLSRMNRIVDFSEDLAYVTVEPGVTQRQLFEFLRDQKSRLWMDATGSSPECSIIGNAMERGFGHTPYGDHFATACGFEVILPTGECISTGFGSLPNAKAASVYRWGVGPVLDGLFTQSNFGIVTRMTIWLMPRPEFTQAYFFLCSSDHDLRRVIDSLRLLRLNGTLRSSVHIGNDYKVLNGLGQFPWEKTNGATPLSRDLMREIRTAMKFGRWNGSGGIYGTKTQVREARRLLKLSLRDKVAGLQFLDDRLLRLASRFARPYSWQVGLDLKRTLDLVEPVFGLIQGVPTDKMLGSCYWRKRGPIPANPDPDRDGCGLLWCAPVAPADGKSVGLMTELAENILYSYGFEPMISLTLTTDRAVTCVVSISYDREVQGEDDRAMQCYRELLDQMTEAGFYSYRLGIQAPPLFAPETDYGRLLARLKQTLDPNQILAPGRYLAPEPAFHSWMDGGFEQDALAGSVANFQADKLVG